MKSLVIVESPTKARTIGRFLGKDYEIKASMGHVMDLPKSKLGVDVEGDFEPQYEILTDKKRIIADLKSAAKTANSIILATDPDREGEAIAAHVAELLAKKAKVVGENSRKQDSPDSLVQRIVFHEITKEAIEEALKNPQEVNVHLVDAQTARRVLDRLVGYKLSPLLWKKVRRGLSAGRVQSVALRLIVEREREIEKFEKEPYYTITAVIVKNQISKIKDQKEGIPFDLVEINGDKIEVQSSFQLYDGEYKVTKTILDTKEKAQSVLDDLKGKSFVVSDVLQKETRRSPQPPYTTSTLQQDAARRLGMPGKRTMNLAQKLYEEGYITYHRTDSVAISSSAQFSIINYVKKEFGEKYAPEKPRFYATKQKLAQEAHEAIRPTAVGQISNIVGNQGWRLYEMIWRRAVASQMSDAIIESTNVIVDARGPQNIYRFKANGSVLVFDGFLKVNPSGLADTRLPKFEKEETLTASDIKDIFHETTPPPRYNDASLIKTLEEKGIGRPSTYATIISTISDRNYIERIDNRFAPTPVGTAVNHFLVQHFSTIDDIPFTAEMEDQLDAIAQGQKEWVSVIRDFYTPFEKRLETVEEKSERVRIEVEQTDEKCPQCGSNLVIRTGRFGKFFACSKFPDCRFTKQFVDKTDLTCPKDRGRVVIKKTRKGRKFFGCSNYPQCDFAAWRLEDIKRVQSSK